MTDEYLGHESFISNSINTHGIYKKNLMAHESKGSSTEDLSTVWVWQENKKRLSIVIYLKMP